MDGQLATDVAVMRRDLANHIKVDEDSIKRIEATGDEIKGLMRDLSKDVREAVQRLHGRIDEEAQKARELANEAADIARAESKIAIGLAQDAHARVDSTKIWVLTGVISGGLAIATIVVEFFHR